MEVEKQTIYYMCMSEEEYNDLIRALRYLDEMRDLKPKKEDEIKEYSEIAYNILNKMIID